MDSSSKDDSATSPGMADEILEANLVAAEAMVGKVVAGKYEIVRLIGEGGMGAVFEAEHTLLRHRVAIKMMHRSLMASDEAFARFLREAQTCGSLNHPNIVAVRDFVVDDDDNIFMVMELLRGESLADLLDRRGALPLERSIAIALQMLSGLHVAHAAGVVHRDLKPDNVFLSVDPRGREEVKILDFGVAKIQTSKDEKTSLTRTGTIIGTPCYLSPEQARARKNVDGRADLWSVGVILYEMLTGKRPFEGRSYNETFSRILLEEPPKVVDLAPHVPRAVAAVVEQALRKEPDERFSCASRMLDALSAAIPWDERSMSSGALRALRRTSEIPLPPAVCDALPTVVDLVGSDQRAKSNPTLMETIASDVSQLVVCKPESRARMWLAGAIAGAGVAFVLALALWRAEPATVVELVPMSATDSAAGPATELAAISPKPPVPVTEPSQKVELTVEALPTGAKAFLDGRPIELPYFQTASDEPHILRVIADGRQTFEVALVLDRDQVVEYRAATTARPRRGAGRAHKERIREMLLENPF